MRACRALYAYSTASKGGASRTPQNGMIIPRTIGRQYRSPHRHLGGALHQVRLEQKTVHDGNDCVQNQNVDRVFPVSPLEHGGKGRTDDAKHGADLGTN